jgi:hypothetical protein
MTWSHPRHRVPRSVGVLVQVALRWLALSPRVKISLGFRPGRPRRCERVPGLGLEERRPTPPPLLPAGSQAKC